MAWHGSAPRSSKFGQALSLRRDLLPDDYLAAPLSLQDHIAPFPPEDAIREIERSLGAPINQMFAEFDPKPMAAAFIAQVHAARLNDGRDVIVKVRRAAIKGQIDSDMRALTWVARLAVGLVPRLGRHEPLRIIDEIWTNLSKEMDFRREAQNIRRFVVAFAEWPAIYVPGVIDELVSEAVIVQVRSGGRRVDDPSLKADGPRLAQAFVDVSYSACSTAIRIPATSLSPRMGASASTILG